MTKNLITIEKPLITNEMLLDAVKNIQSISGTFFYRPLLLKTESPKYLSWEQIKYKNWVSNPAAFWAMVKVYRLDKQPTPIQDTSGIPFKWKKLNHYERLLHNIDKTNLGGRLLNIAKSGVTDEDEKKKYLTRSLIEEAIASAQLEGAHTTREQARKMIHEGHTPAGESQHMIYNNYLAMQKIEKELKDQKLDLEGLLNLHNTLTQNTLKNPDQAGRFRTSDEKIEVGSDMDNQIAYIPPPVEFVEQQMPRLIAWANDKLDEGDFMHPVLKAIALHFWIGFLHPFADGNGRMARALFYWYLLRNGYWAFAYIPVSTRIKKSPKQYAWSYIYSEQDDNDLTYFMDYNLRQIELARTDFEQYAREKAGEALNIGKIEKSFPDFNSRQLQLIHFFSEKPGERTNVTSLVRIHGITAATAVKDLKIMEQQKLLTKERKGRNIFYYPTGKLLSKLKS